MAWRLCGLAVLAGLVCATAQPVAASTSGPVTMPNTQLEPVTWAALDGWAADDHAAAFTTFLASCRPIVRSTRSIGQPRPVRAALQHVCRRALSAKISNAAAARKFFEENFRPVRITTLGESNGFLTGYYEPIVEGSRQRTEQYTVPIYAKPSDLVVAGRRHRTGAFPNKGAKVGRRVGLRKIVPYYDRAEIEDGALDGRGLEIAWVKDPIDAFFAQIQGSLRVRLEDGAMLRLNYVAHNGHPYIPVGRILIERNIVPREEMSMERIRKWMEENPDGGKELRRQNRSFVFFRETGLSENEEPVGAQGVPLTTGRSIAVDRLLHVYGTPFFIEAELPIESERSATKLRRLMVGQDTGSAIVGPARADLYWGAGDEAGRVSGRFKHPGRFAMLFPRELDPVAAGAEMPLPRPKPSVAQLAEPAKPAVKAAVPAARHNKHSPHHTKKHRPRHRR